MKSALSSVLYLLLLLCIVNLLLVGVLVTTKAAMWLAGLLDIGELFMYGCLTLLIMVVLYLVASVLENK